MEYTNMDLNTDKEGFFYYSKDGTKKIYPMKKMESWIIENMRIAKLNGEKTSFNKEYKNYVRGGNFGSPEIKKRVEETLKNLGNGNLSKGLKAYALEVEKKINLEKQKQLEQEKKQQQEILIKQQIMNEQEKDDIKTSIAIDSITKDIVIEPYSRKLEDIEAMKLFVSNVSGNDIEKITNDQAQAFIDNLGIPDDAYITAKADGTFEYTNNNPYSSEIHRISKTSKPKEILSIIEAYANWHRTAWEEPDPRYIKDYEFIHSINEMVSEIENTNTLENGDKNMGNKTMLNEVAFDFSTANKIKFENKDFSYKIVDIPETSSANAHKELHLMSENSENEKLVTIAQIPYSPNYFDNMKPEEIQAEVTKQLGIAKKNIDPEIGKEYFDYSNENAVEFDNKNFTYEIVFRDSTPKHQAYKELQIYGKDSTGKEQAVVCKPYYVGYFDNMKPEEIQAEVTKQLGIAKKNIDPEIGKEYFDYSNIQEEQNKEDIVQKVTGFQSFDEVKVQYPNAVDLSNSDKKKMSYDEVTDYLKSIVNDVMVTSDGHNIAISDDFDHIEKSSSFTDLNRRGKNEVKTYAAEVEKLITHSEFQKEIDNKDSAKVDTDKFRYYTVPVWINNRGYNVLLECGVLKDETSINASRNGEPNKHVSGSSKEKYIRKTGRLQVADISYLYNIRNRPLFTKNQQLQAELDKERATHNSSCVITVPQRDSNGNIKKDSHGNPLTTTLNCSEGTYGALSKLSSKVVDLTFENKKLREQLNHQNNISPKSPSDDEWGR